MSLIFIYFIFLRIVDCFRLILFDKLVNYVNDVQYCVQFIQIYCAFVTANL